MKNKNLYFICLLVIPLLALGQENMTPLQRTVSGSCPLENETRGPQRVLDQPQDIQAFIEQHGWRSGRIVGGEDADIEDYPWQVALMQGNTQFFGGSIIHEQWILTAAHCVSGSWTPQYIRAGVTNRTHTSGQDINVVQEIVHPDHHWPVPHAHDIALLKLEPPLDLTDPKVGIIPIVTAANAAAGMTNPGVVSTITGWGATSQGGSSSDILQVVDVPIVSNEDAMEIGGYNPGSISEDMLCAGFLGVGGADACQGDSGGPLVVPDGLGGYKLAGVTSWGVGCAQPDYPGVYARVSYFEDWINEKIFLQGKEVFFAEDFSGIGSGEIPAGWTRTHTNWGATNTNNAGGEAPEMQFSWTPSATDVFRLATPMLNATNMTNVHLAFKHMVNDYSGNYTLKVQTSPDGITWTDQWQIMIAKSEEMAGKSRETTSERNVPPTEVMVDLEGVEMDNFYLAFVFEGNSFNINFWYLDDIFVAGQPLTGLPFAEAFTGIGAGEIPEGWTRTHTNWGVANSNHAGGEAPEMRFYFSPSSTDVFRLATPLLDARQIKDLQLSFRHMVNDYSGNYTLKVQTSTDGVTWTDQWELYIAKSTRSEGESRETGGRNVPATQVFVDLEGVDLENFYLAFVFEGNSFNINYWFVDDVWIEGIPTAELPFAEDFSGTEPGGIPQHWMRTHTNWGVWTTNYAGGEPPEMVFSFSPSSTDVFRLITPMLNAKQADNVPLSFRQAIWDWSGDYTLKVQTSPDGVSWTTQWEQYIAKSDREEETIDRTSRSRLEDLLEMPAAQSLLGSKNHPDPSFAGKSDVQINLAGVAGEDFYLAFVFDGNSYNIDYWFIDDIMVGETDAIPGITVNPESFGLELVPGSSVSQSLMIQNTGEAGSILDANLVVAPVINGKNQVGFKENKPKSGNASVLYVNTMGGADTDFKSAMQVLPNVAIFETFDAYADTPTLEYMLSFDIILVASEMWFQSPSLLGDRLAEYVDFGGRVCLFQGTLATGGSWMIEGDIALPEYSPLNRATYTLSQAVISEFFTHPITYNVETINSGFYGYNQVQGTGISLGNYNTGYPMAAYNQHKPVVAFNIFPYNGFWGGDLVQMVENTIDWLMEFQTGVEWLSLDIYQTTVPAGSSQQIQVSADAGELEPGMYEANILIFSNDPVNPLITIPVTLNVNAPQLSVSPESFNETVVTGSMITRSLTILNQGEMGHFSLTSTESYGGKLSDLNDIYSGATETISGNELAALINENSLSTLNNGIGGKGSEAFTLTRGGTVLDSCDTGLAGPWGVGFNLTDHSVWFSNIGAGGGDDFNHEFEINGTPTGKSTNADYGGTFAADMAYNPHTGKFWQVNVGGDNALHEFDPNTGATGNTISGPWSTSQRGLAYDPVNQHFFVGGWNTPRTIYQLDDSGNLIESWPVDINISGLAYKNGLLFIIENSPSDAVSVFNVNAGMVMDVFTINGFGNYSGAGLSPMGNALWAANQGNDAAYLIDTGYGLDWISFIPESGSISAGEQVTVDVTFNASGLEAGVYQAEILVLSNDPVNPLITVPVTLEVTDPMPQTPQNLTADLNAETGEAHLEWEYPGFYDDFAEDTGHWQFSDDRINIQNGKLQMNGNSNDAWASAYYDHLYSDFVFEYEVTRLESEATITFSIGAFIRSDGFLDGTANGYLVNITAGGSYSAWRRVNGVSTAIISWTPSPHINTGMGASNIVSIHAMGSTFHIYINGEYINSFTDNTYTVGYVGLGTYDASEGANLVKWDYAHLQVMDDKASQEFLALNGVHETFAEPAGPIDEEMEEQSSHFAPYTGTILHNSVPVKGLLGKGNPGTKQPYDHFNIYRNDQLIDNTPNTSYTDQLTDYGEYTYHVTAVTGANESGPSNAETVNWESICPPPDWEPTPYLQFNMNVIAHIVIDGEISVNPNDILGAFVDGECRGIASPMPEFDGLVFLTIGSNIESGEVIDLVIWDSQQCVECQTWQTLTFENLALIGTLDDPYIVECSEFMELNLTFGHGFTWFSMNVDPGSMGVNDLLQDLEPCDGDRVLSQGPFSVYNQSIDMWVGTLTAIDPSQMYVMDLCSQQGLSLHGAPVSYDPVDLGAGFTWLGYLPQGCLPTSTALSGIQPSPVDNDRIISQTGFATYSTSFDMWLGSLSQMCPGQGYVIQMNNASVLTYPGIGEKAYPETVEPAMAKSPAGIYPETHLRYTMMLLANLETGDGNISIDEGDMIYAFVDDQCRGMAAPMPGLNGAIFMNIGSNLESGEVVHFKAWLNESQELVDLRETLSYQSLGAAGTLDEPFMLITASESPTAAEYPDISGQIFGNPYPNPTQGNIHFPYSLNEPAEINLFIYSSVGQLIYNMGSKHELPGAFKLEVEKGKLPKGVFFYKLVMNNHKTTVQKTGTLVVMD